MKYTVAIRQTYTIEFESADATDVSADHIARRILPRTVPLSGLSRTVGAWSAQPGTATVESVEKIDGKAVAAAKKQEGIVAKDEALELF